MVKTAQRGPMHTADAGQRVAFVDAAKGICIILVVMMHSTLGLGEALGRQGFMHEIVAFARPFRMPDFFLISGLFLSRVIDRDWRTYADRRVFHFVYFYVMWTLIQFSVKGWGLATSDPAELVRQLAVAAIEPFGTLWFIYLLALFSALTKLARDLPPRVLFGFAAVLHLLPIHTGFTVIDESAARYVFFVAGYLLAPVIFRFSAGVARHPVWSLAGLCIWGFVNASLAFTPTGFALYPTVAALPGFGLALGLSGALAVIAIATLLTRVKLEAPLRYCGEHSIAIYLAFFLPMAALRTGLVKLDPTIDVGIGAAAITAFAVVVPLLLERVCRGTLLSFLFVRPQRLRVVPRPSRLAPAE